MSMSDEARNRIKEQIEQIMQDTGMTPGEVGAESFSESMSEQEELRRLYEKANSGELQWESFTSTVSWEEAQQRDLETNFLYGEYLQHRLTARDPLSFEEYTRWVGIKALFRLMSRIQGGTRMAQNLHYNLDVGDIQRFMTLDKHQEKDPRLLIQTFLKEVRGGWEATNNLLLMYRNRVEGTWEKKRMKNEKTPLPGDNDWYFENETPLEQAVEAYLAGASINAAAAMYGIGNRKLSRELTRLGIERVQRKGSK